jgi:hypothetical protein
VRPSNHSGDGLNDRQRQGPKAIYHTLLNRRGYDVPIRIILRGLILLDVKNEGQEAGTITARLIDGPAMVHHDMGAASALHRHTGEMQIYPGATATPAMEGETDASHADGGMHDGGEEDPAHPIPFEYFTMKPGENFDVKIDSGEFVKRDESYKVLCPSLREIAKSAGLERQEDEELKAKFVRNTVTINRGTIRVRDVVSWDSGAPELGEHRQQGINSSVPVTFIGSDITRNVASECVIDIRDAPSVMIGEKEYRGSEIPSVHVAPNMVEILITNFAPQRAKPLPWSLHYRWVFEAAGYTARILRRDDLDKFDRAVAGYDESTLRAEKAMFLHEEANGEKVGLPFPYIDLNNRLLARATPTGPAPAMMMADPWDRPLCPLGDDTPPPGGI